MTHKKLTKFGHLRKYLRNKEGSTAIEFALLALPFSALLFAIVETAVVFFISSSISHALSEAGRNVRLGSFQEACGDSADTFRDLVCENMVTIGNCQAQLTVDLVRSSDGTFQTNVLPPLPPEDPSDLDAAPTIPASTYQSSGGNDVVIARARFFHRLALPGNLTLLANRAGNIRLIEATTAFRNEPFNNVCS